MKITEALGLSVLGIAIVFLVLLLLMLVIYLLSVFAGKPQKADTEPSSAQPARAGDKPALAPGSAGEICMFDVPDKDAAMIMAIVADKLDAPLNELRFLSIKEVKENEI